MRKRLVIQCWAQTCFHFVTWLVLLTTAPSSSTRLITNEKERRKEREREREKEKIHQCSACGVFLLIQTAHSYIQSCKSHRSFLAQGLTGKASALKSTQTTRRYQFILSLTQIAIWKKLSAVKTCLVSWTLTSEVSQPLPPSSSRVKSKGTYMIS